jgi:putative ABC transport system permease protein
VFSDFWFRLRALIFSRRADAEMADEIQFHLECEREKLEARGLGEPEARRRSMVAFGGVSRTTEDCRDARGTRWFEDLVQDLRYTFRTLRQQPTFTAVIVCTLALGGGATTTMFTVINGALLKPLPYPEPARLVSVNEQTDFSTQLGNRWAFAYPNFLDCVRDVRSMTLAAWRVRRGTVTTLGEPEYVNGRLVSPELFSILQAPLIHGRTFLEEENRPGGPPVAIISYGLWQRQYRGDVAALTKPLVWDGTSYTVIGVTAPAFAFAATTDVFTLLGQSTDPRLQNREAHPGIQVWARLNPGATLVEAQTELTLIGKRLATAYPASNKGRTFVAEPLRPFVGDVAPTLWLLLGAVGLVLLIACANIANLLLARARSRDREMAMRVALGAGRARLMRQCLTESVVLGLLGGAAGVAIAMFGVDRFVAIWPGGLPRADQVRVDRNVLLFAVGVSFAIGILFGLAPALRVHVITVEQELRAGARSIVGRRRLHGGFVTAQIALTLVLLVCAGMLGRALLRLSSLSPGLDTQNVLITRMALSPSVLNDPSATRAAWDDVLTRARTVSGLKAIAMVDTVPMREGNNQLRYATSPAAPPPEQQPVTLATSVSPDYLTVMGIPLVAGRFVDDHDRLGTTQVVVIDEVLARDAFGRDDPVGKRLWIQGMGPGPVTVVGVVGHVRHWGFAIDDQATVRAQFYYPFAQVPDENVRRWSELMSIAVRTTIDPQSVVAALRRELRGAGGDQVMYQVQTLDALADSTLARQRFLMVLFSAFAAIALLLACVGIYGVLAYLTSQRVSEFGIRVALGATRGAVMRLVLGQSLRLIVIGIALGLLSSIAAATLLERFVDGVGSLEPTTVILMLAVLVVPAILASVIPARRAGLVDAMHVIRQE